MTLFIAIVLVLAAATLGFAAAGVVAWLTFTRLMRRLSTTDSFFFEMWAMLHRQLASLSGYESIALTTEQGRVVVPLEAVAWSIEACDLLTHEPVSVTPPDPEKTPLASDDLGTTEDDTEACDGRA